MAFVAGIVTATRATSISCSAKGESEGTVHVAVDRKSVKTVTVTGDTLYTLDLSFSSGTGAYAFTFG